MRELNEQELEQVVGGASISAFGGLANGTADAAGTGSTTFSFSDTAASFNPTGTSTASASNVSFGAGGTSADVSSFAASGNFSATF